MRPLLLATASLGLLSTLPATAFPGLQDPFPSGLAHRAQVSRTGADGHADSTWTPPTYSLDTIGSPGGAPTTVIPSSGICTPTVPSSTLGACTVTAAGSSQGTQVRRTVDACGIVSTQPVACTLEGRGTWAYLFYRTTGGSLSNPGSGFMEFQLTCMPSLQVNGAYTVYDRLPESECTAPRPFFYSCYTPVMTGGWIPPGLNACDGSAPQVMARDWQAQWCAQAPELCR